MLYKFSKGICALALATAFSTHAAQAEVHSVLVMDGGFFPAVSYVNPGDSIVFTNNSEGPLRLAGSDGSWSSESLEIDAQHTLQIDQSTSMDFVAVAQEAAVEGDEGEVDAEYINLDDVLMEGAISFNAAPLEDNANG